MKAIFFLFLLFSFKTFAKFDADISGNLEGQGRHSWNNEDAKKDLMQDWDDEDFYLIYGNLDGKVEMNGSRLEANIFARHSKSDLYENDYIASQIFTFPNKLVARDVFKLQHKKEVQDSRTELILNKLYYEWDYEEHRFMVGRIYINYGLGEIFNPINPFNQPTGLTAISQVAQGNDGFNFTFFVSDKYTVDFFLLGDKSVDGYEGQIDRTLWVHGEYQFSDKLQFDYVIGEDQKRDKLGAQVRYSFPEAMVFMQTLFQTDYVNNEKSHLLWDMMIGYDQQIMNKWHIRAEGGYQKLNRYANLDTLSERFLPTEYFIAIANQYEIHPLVKITGTIVNDVKSGFTYFIARNTFDLGHSTEAEIFGYIPMAKGDKFSYPAQKLVTTDIGMALRTFF